MKKVNDPPMLIKLVLVKDLNAAEYNPRKITDAELEKLQDSIRKFGLTEPMVINKYKGRENVVISGHQRLKACKKLGIKTVPCIFVNLKPLDEKELNIKMNRIGGSFDFELLTDFFDAKDLLEWGFEEDELEYGDIKIIDSSDSPDTRTQRMMRVDGISVVNLGFIHTTMERDFVEKMCEKIRSEMPGEQDRDKLEAFITKAYESIFKD